MRYILANDYALYALMRRGRYSLVSEPSIFWEKKDGILMAFDASDHAEARKIIQTALIAPRKNSKYRIILWTLNGVGLQMVIVALGTLAIGYISTGEIYHTKAMVLPREFLREIQRNSMILFSSRDISTEDIIAKAILYSKIIL